MLAQCDLTLTIARREWLRFVRGRHFLIVGLISPLVLTAMLSTVILLNGDTTDDGSNRWQYFQSELQRFGDDVKGKYIFEKSSDRMLFYVVDQTGMNLDSAIQQEILRRDIANMIAFLKNIPYDEWQWFGDLQDEDSNSKRELLDALSNEYFTADELIEMYSLQHDATFSSRLATTEENYAWFVEGWNDHIDDIAHTIPVMSFNHAVMVLDANDERNRAAWVPTYVEIPEDFLETLRGDFFVAESSTPYKSLVPEMNQVQLAQTWIAELVETVSKSVLQHKSNMDKDPTTGDSNLVSFDLKTTDSLNEIARKHERTRGFSSFTFTSLYLLFVGYAWGLLQFDPNFTPKRDFSLIESSSKVIDGRALGTMLKVTSIAIVWFVLLFVPEFVLIGTNPMFGVGALALIFHPSLLLNYFLFVLLGLWTSCYILDALRLFRQSGRFLAVLLFSIHTGFLMLNMDSSPIHHGSQVELLFLFFPLIGPIAMVKYSLGYPDALTYSSIVLVAIGYLIGFRFFIKNELKLQVRKGMLRYRFHPR